MSAAASVLTGNVLEHRLERIWKIRLMANPDLLQQAIFKNWVKD
jgi:hypothetical protein